MTTPPAKPGTRIAHPRRSKFTFRPGDADRWIKSRETQPRPRRKRGPFAARLTIDVTPDLRGRIKVAAFRRGVTVADMLRDLLLKTFPDTDGGTP
jgi:hypothetical protein